MEVKKAAQKKIYDKEFKIQPVKPGRKIGFSEAAKELGINVDTLYGWNKRAKDARLDSGPGTQTPNTAMTLTEEVQKLRQQNREQAKEIARLKGENARCQSSPDDRQFCGSVGSQYKQTGNAVPVNLAFDSGKKLKKHWRIYDVKFEFYYRAKFYRSCKNNY